MGTRSGSTSEEGPVTWSHRIFYAGRTVLQGSCRRSGCPPRGLPTFRLPTGSVPGRRTMPPRFESPTHCPTPESGYVPHAPRSREGRSDGDGHRQDSTLQRMVYTRPSDLVDGVWVIREGVSSRWTVRSTLSRTISAPWSGRLPGGRSEGGSRDETPGRVLTPNPEPRTRRLDQHGQGRNPGTRRGGPLGRGNKPGGSVSSLRSQGGTGEVPGRRGVSRGWRPVEGSL